MASVFGRCEDNFSLKRTRTIKPCKANRNNANDFREGFAVCKRIIIFRISSNVRVRYVQARHVRMEVSATKIPLVLCGELVICSFLF